MSTTKIATEQWQKLYEYLRAHPHAYARKEEACRRYVDGVFWIMRTGVQWRELPERYGNWGSAYTVFAPCEKVSLKVRLSPSFV